MGNAASVEAPRKGSRAPQKLSKPRTGNSATAGLLNPNSVSGMISRSTSTRGRRLSLPYASTPAPSPRHLGTGTTTVEDLVTSNGDSVPEDCLSSSLFQSDPSRGALQQRSQSAGVVASVTHGQRMSRTNSIYIGADEGYEQAQLGLAANLLKTASQSSMNYDKSSYEAKRLLNLVEEPSFEDHSIASESHFQVTVSRRQSYTPSHHPAQSGAATPLPRTNSDVSLYTPMRRRSLMTPGVATRPAPADLVMPPKIQSRCSLPATPARRDSLESMGPGFLSTSRPSIDPSLIPRAHTPCEAEYQQTGAFKHGTLRITNGSPARTPAWEATDDHPHNKSSQAAVGQNNYFDAKSQAKEKQTVDSARKSDGTQYPGRPNSVTESSVALASNPAIMTDEQGNTTDFLPELKLTMTPISKSEIEPRSPDLQTTSKHTAMEDELFEDGPLEYANEVLNVRHDHDAKSHPSLTSPSVEEEKLKKIDRSDSGIVASPTSRASHKSLSKADSGYSSSVSIRSLSSKRNARQEVDHYRSMEAVSPQGPTFEHAELSANTSMWPRSASVGPPEVRFQGRSWDRPLPPVPDKDHPAKVSKHDVSLPHDSRSSSGKVELPSKGILASETQGPSPSVPKSPSTPTSTLSISSAPRKQGRLQRFLSGARVPLTVHVTHALDKEVDVPPVPQAVQAKLHEHSGLSPNSFDNPLFRADAQKDSSVSTKVTKTGIAEDRNSTIQAPQDDALTGRTGQDKTHSRKSNFHIHLISSTITRAASSVIAKNPMRKPTHARTKEGDTDATKKFRPGTPTKTIPRPSETSKWHQKSVEIVNSISLTTTDERAWYRGPPFTRGRSNSISASIGDLNATTYDDPHHSNKAIQSEQHTTAFQKPASTSQYLISRTPPPVSMKTRNMGSLRVPPPIRPRSSPPGKTGGPTLSRKSSRDGIQSYPPYTHAMESNHIVLSRRSSQESFYAYSPAQIRALLSEPSQTPIINTRHPSSVQPYVGEYRVSNGTPHPKHGTTLSREPSFDHSRRNSLASQTSHQSAPSNQQPWPRYPPHDLPALKHRSSYDGYSFQTKQSYIQTEQSYGQTHVSNPRSGQPVIQQSRQYQQHTRYVSRGHLRHYSLDQYGSPAPYRVLHSYNSPAYKGVPIWSG
ncbi:hypothetical protein HD806DRAFT_379727 [Xylariaceae sp. AK1471]|nr:hypothetical protein HD806DRAFT_379727 [Xylariaceae sp. AK1471]